MKTRYWWYNPKAKVIAQSLKNSPEDWKYDGIFNYCVIHVPSNLKVWVGNGWWFVAIQSPEQEKLGLFGRTHVWWEYLKWNKNFIHQKRKKNQIALDTMLKGQT